jgi:hypothetical protein
MRTAGRCSADSRKISDDCRRCRYACRNLVSFWRSSIVAHGIETAANARRKIALSVISLAEIVYLVEKGRFIPSVYDDIQRALHDPSHVLQEAPVTVGIIDARIQLARDVAGGVRAISVSDGELVGLGAK